MPGGGRSLSVRGEFPAADGQDMASLRWNQRPSTDVAEADAGAEAELESC
jgi:hypothetical protein